MKLFIKKTFLFCLPLLGLLLLGIFMPPTPRASESLIMAAKQKDSLLINVPANRLILMGGSNVSFGFNSGILKDSLGLNPINTSVHIGLGLSFMMATTLEHVQEGDILLVVPEYNMYYQDLNRGTEQLLRSICDVDISKARYLNLQQALYLLPLLPDYAKSKFDVKQYRNYKVNPVYTANSFNEYGDAYVHWSLPAKENIAPFDKLKGDFKPEVIALLQEFEAELTARNAKLLLSYPTLQAQSYDNLLEQIQTVQQALEASGLTVLGTPQQFRYPDSLYFDTPYHLTYEGGIRRTKALVELIRQLE